MTNFGWSYPAGAARDQYAPYNQKEELTNDSLKNAFPDAYGPYDLYRQIYKYSACGPSIGFCINYWDNEIVKDGPCAGETYEVERSKWIYCDNLLSLGTWADMDRKGELVSAISISSIVEGVDDTTDTYIVDTLKLNDDPEAIAKTFYNHCDKVEQEAQAIWDDTHGCESCRKHWQSEGCEYDDDDMVPVWTECPHCGGSGTVI